MLSLLLVVANDYLVADIHIIHFGFICQGGLYKLKGACLVALKNLFHYLFSLLLAFSGLTNFFLVTLGAGGLNGQGLFWRAEMVLRGSA